MSITVNQLLQKAEEKVGKGDWDGAIHLLDTVLRQAPENGDALHFLGLIKYQLGNLKASLPLLKKAVEISKGHPAVLANYGSVLNAVMAWSESELVNRQALEKDPNKIQALIGLATSLMEQGQLEIALEVCKKAAQIDNKNPSVQITLGNINRRLRQLDDAVHSYQCAVECDPKNALAYANLGAILREKGMLEAAESACRRAIELRPDYAEAYNNLGVVLAADDDNMGAFKAFEKALSLNPAFFDAGVNRGGALYKLDRMDEAEEAYENIIKLNSGDPISRNGLGVVLLARGQTLEAATQFRQAIDLDPTYGEAIYNLASSRHGQLSAEDVTAIEGLIAEGNLNHSSLVFLHFALSEVADHEKDWENAFAHAMKGNQVRNALLESQGYTFDADAFDLLADEIMAQFDKSYFENSWKSEDGSKKPVFVFGMPRSGTTLVEQILASHPEIYGGGELDKISKLVNAIVDGDYPAGIHSIDQVKAALLADDHVNFLDELAGGEQRIVDKTPFNFLYLGLIAQMFPGASLVHCTRDPRDTAISCYFQNFVSPHAWPTDLRSIGRYISTYKRIMSHWADVLPVPITEIAYESLVSDQEVHSQRLIEAVDLPWEECCLDFHTSKRPVKTASSWQVRQPIHSKAVERWRRYEAYLQPIIEEI